MTIKLFREKQAWKLGRRCVTGKIWQMSGTFDECLETFDNVLSDGVTDRPKREDRWGGLRNHVHMNESVSERQSASKN